MDAAWVFRFFLKNCKCNCNCNSVITLTRRCLDTERYLACVMELAPVLTSGWNILHFWCFYWTSLCLYMYRPRTRRVLLSIAPRLLYPSCFQYFFQDCLKLRLLTSNAACVKACCVAANQSSFCFLKLSYERASCSPVCNSYFSLMCKKHIMTTSFSPYHNFRTWHKYGRHFACDVSDVLWTGRSTVYNSKRRYHPRHDVKDIPSARKRPKSGLTV